MIRFFTPTQAPERDILAARGGFIWWYLDLLDENGDGLVMIWSFGLPFLPGYAAAARAGQAPAAGELPSLNLAVYQGGRERFYLLQQLDPAEAQWTDDEVVHLGQSQFRSAREGRQRAVEATLDCPLPGGGRLRGRLWARGPATRCEHPDPESLSGHAWTPLLSAARGGAELHIQGESSILLNGRAYHDRNASRAPLHELGIDRWFWARAAMPDGERIVYALWPEDGGEARVLQLQVGEDGATTRRDGGALRLVGARRRLYGMEGAAGLELDGLSISLPRLVEDGPFYLRYQGTMRVDGAEGPAVAEWVCPARVDLDAHRPFVKMRVHDLRGPNSPMLPWFAGSRSGRWRRLGQSLWGGVSP